MVARDQVRGMGSDYSWVQSFFREDEEALRLGDGDG